MEGSYPPGFYCPDRDQQENRHQPSQPPPPPPQQHIAHYPFDLPVPYYAVSQQQQQQQQQQQHSEYVVDQSTRAFPVPQPAAPMLSPGYHDAGPVLSNSNAVQQAHQQRPVTLKVQGAKSTNLLANYTQPITTHEPAITSREPAITSREPAITSREPAITSHEPAITSREPPITTHEPAITSREPAIERNNLPVTTCESFAESNIPSTTTHEPATGGSNLPSSTSEPVVESNIQPFTTQESVVKSQTLHPQGQTSLEPTSLKQAEDTDQAVQRPASTTQPVACPLSPDNSDEEPPIFAALNLRKTNSVTDLPSSLSLRVASQDKVEGVVAKQMIKKGAEFGPYRGTLMSEEEGWSKNTTWEICVAGGVYRYMDGCKMWMSHIRCAQNEEDQNLEAYQYYGEIYYRCTKVIEPGSELRVFYSKEYGKHTGIRMSLKDLRFNQDAQKFQCSQCEGLFPSAKLILRHMKYEHTHPKRNQRLPTVSGNKICRKPIRLKISSKHLFKRKIKASDQDDSVFKCGTCEKAFSSSGRLKAHEIFHDYNQDHTCPVCGKRQKNAQTWAKHMMLHKPVHESRPHKCNECNGRYKSKAALRKHEHQIHGYPCRLCSERFSRKKDCMKHEQTHQAYIPSYAAAEYLVPAPLPDEPVDMLGKKGNYHQLRFKCRFCPNRYSDHKTAMTHEKEKHTMEGAFKCSHCSKIFSCESRLKAHLLIHEQTRIYRCTLCPKGFASESALNNHQGEHTGLKPAKCDVCGKGFRTRKSALAHRRRVHQERPKRFLCSFCNYGFADKGDLKKHEDRHKGIRRYVCRECDKRFTSNTSLTAHVIAIHRKERPFSCEICGQSFALNFKYTLHMVKHNVQGGSSSVQQ